MLEVLIAIVVLSLGLLGYAGLQSVSIKNNHNAYLRSQATVLAYDILDRIRANRAAKASYPMDYGTDPAAGTDAGNWKQALKNALPNGDADIKFLDTGTGGVADKVIVKIRWYDGVNNTDLTPVFQEFITQSRM